jgi:outer membrane protein TolC
MNLLNKHLFKLFNKIFYSRWIFSERFLLVNLIIISFFSVIQIQAQTLEEYLKIAAENNNGLKSSFYSYQASLKKIEQVGSLPDPQLSFGYFIKPMERWMGNQIADISLMQMFPWFGTLNAAESEAALMAKSEFEKFNSAKSKLFYEVKKNYYELYLTKSNISITSENIEILRTLERIASNRLKGDPVSQSKSSNSLSRNKSNTISSQNNMNDNKMDMNSDNSLTGQLKNKMDGSMNNSMSAINSNNSMIDILRIQMEINDLQNQLELLRESYETLVVKFNSLLNRKTDLNIDIPESISTAELSIPIEEIEENIKSQNPMLKMLNNEEKAFAAKEEMNRKKGYPMVGLGLQYSIFEKRKGSSMNPNNMIMPMATITIPIWRGKYDGAIDEAIIKQNQFSELQKETENQLLVRYKKVIQDLNDAERRMILYKTQIKIVDQTYNLLLANYSTAAAQFEELLRTQQQLIDYRFKSIKAKIDFNLLVAEIEMLIGN